MRIFALWCGSKVSGVVACCQVLRLGATSVRPCAMGVRQGEVVAMLRLLGWTDDLPMSRRRIHSPRSATCAPAQRKSSSSRQTSRCASGHPAPTNASSNRIMSSRGCPLRAISRWSASVVSTIAVTSRAAMGSNA